MRCTLPNWDIFFTFAFCLIPTMIVGPAILAPVFTLPFLIFFFQFHKKGQFGDYITALRLAFIIGVFGFQPSHEIFIATVIIAVGLDGLDGFVARKTKSSEFGEFFDMEVDTFLSFLLCASAIPQWGFWPLLLVIIRPIYIFLGRMLGTVNSQRLNRPSSMLGKSASVFSTMTLIASLHIDNSLFIFCFIASFIFLMISFSYDFRTLNWQNIKHISPRYKWAIGLVLNVIFITLLFRHLVTIDFEWKMPISMAHFSASVTILIFAQFLNCYRLYWILHQRKVSQQFANVCRVGFFSLFTSQLINFVGTTDVIKFSLLKGDRLLLIKSIAMDKAIVLLSAICLVAFSMNYLLIPIMLIFIWPAFRKSFVPFLLGGLCFSLISLSFSICTLGWNVMPDDLITSAKVLLMTVLMPFTLSDWGVREFFAGLLSPDSTQQALAGSITFGVSSLVASLPGLLVWLHWGRKSLKRT